MIYIANWKMSISFQEAKDFLFKFKNFIQKEEKDNFIFLPPALLAGLFGQESLLWGGQNIHWKDQGAFTGENSISTLNQMGAQFCLVGHSERRHVFGETEVDIEKKFHLINEHGLIPILCVGELQHERSKKEQALSKQLKWVTTYEKYQNLPWKKEGKPASFQSTPFIVAYEPVWSIGTNETPSPDEINEAHEFIKSCLNTDSLPVCYGGSVSQKNIQSFCEKKHVDGFLVGRSSLKAEDFYSLYTSTKDQ